MEFVLASNNKNKVEEIKNILPKSFKVKTLSEMSFFDDLEETGLTFEENALQKARFISKIVDCNVIADDSGLCINALNGEPGVKSKRYSSKGTDKDNILKVLKKLNGKRSEAVFKTVIAFIDENKKEYIFTGECNGEILEKSIGENGFGYDPIFYSYEYKKSFAQLTPFEKNSISHRKKALDKFSDFINNLDNEI